MIDEALIEYGFPTDAVRRIEDNHSALYQMDVDNAKSYCRTHYQSIIKLLDAYENKLFINAINSF